MFDNKVKIVISNVNPILPNKVIHGIFKEHAINVNSPITMVKVGGGEEAFKHIFSFRRQISVHPDDVDKIPPCKQVKYEGLTFNLYFSSKKISCFRCKKEGHTAQHCKEELEIEIEKEISGLVNHRTLTDDNVLEPVIDATSPPSKAVNKDIDNIITEGNVTREASVFNKTSAVSMRESKSSSNNNNNRKTATKKNKLLSPITPELVAEQIDGASSCLEQNTLKSFSLGINDFKQFIVHTLKLSYKQVPDALSLYTQDTNCLMLMIDALYDGLTDRRLKSRLTKIKKQFISSGAQSTDSSTDDETTSNTKFNG